MAERALHVVFVPSISFTHCRQMVPFVIHLIQQYSTLSFTILAWKDSLSDFRKGAERFNLTLDDTPRIRLIGIAESSNGNAQPREEYRAFGDAFAQAYKNVVDGGSLVCCETKKQLQFDSLPRPSLVIGAMFIPGLARTVKELSASTKFLVFVPSTASGFLRPCGPTELGGLGSWEQDTKAKLASEPASELNTTEAVARALEYQFTGAPIPSPDGVSMFDYELYPQDVAPSSIAEWLWEDTRQVNVAADGVIILTTPNYEPQTTEALRDWYSGELGKRLFFVGPQVYPEQPSTDEAPADVPRGSNAIVLNFLDSHPPKSVWFISFGTTYFPYNCLGYFQAVIKTLKELNVPILLTWGWSDMVPKGAIPPGLELEMRQTNTGLIVEWIHQQDAVLRHPSIGVFLSHGGLNSMWEAILANVLCVYWPFAVDQPLNAAYLSSKVDCAFELIQVRTGPGSRLPCRGGTVAGTDEAVIAEIKQIVEDVQGEVGERKRRHLASLRQEVLEAMEGGGECHQSIEALLAYAQSEN